MGAICSKSTEQKIVVDLTKLAQETWVVFEPQLQALEQRLIAQIDAKLAAVAPLPLGPRAKLNPAIAPLKILNVSVSGLDEGVLV